MRRWLFLLLFVFSCAAAADDTAQTVVHLLDYIGVDYPGFVRNGKVIDAGEYQEQREFAAQAQTLIGRLPEAAARKALLEDASRLKSLIDAKASGDDVAKLAAALRWRVIDAYKVAVAPKHVPDVKRGASLFEAQCAACHGAQGRGDGPAACGLDPAPENFHDRNRMSQRSLYSLYSTITLGVKGTAMQGYGGLTEDDRWALAFFVGALDEDTSISERGARLWSEGKARSEVANLRAIATLTAKDVGERNGPEAAAVYQWLRAHPDALESTHSSPIAYTRKLLAESLDAYRNGKREEAQRVALNAYLEGFEPVEATLDTVDRALRQEIEREMIAYRELVRRGEPQERVSAAAQRIDSLLDTGAQKLRGESLTASAAAVSAYLILVREGIEALLVIAALAAFLVKAGRRESLVWIHAGWIGALVLGGITWWVAGKLIGISGATRELTEGITALLAAAILLYVGWWLHEKSHARAWQSFIDRHMRDALQRGTLWALAGLSFLAVYRESFETVLFYQALWQQAGEAAQGSVMLGFFSGAGTLALLAWMILRYGVRLPIGPFFAVCSALMAVLAVGFTGNGIKALQEADVVAASPTSGISVPVLGIYPTMQTLLAQALVLGLILVVYLWMRNGRTRRP